MTSRTHGTARALVLFLITFFSAVALQVPNALASTGFRVNSQTAGKQAAPAIDGNRVVWEDDGSDTIRAKDLATSTETTVYDSTVENLSPAISGTKVVWNRDFYEIMMKDVVSGTLTTVTASIQSSPPGSAFLPGNPAISGSTVVWEDHRRSPDPGDIYTRSIPGSEYAVASYGGAQLTPSNSGNNVVWADSYLGNYDIRISKSGALGYVSSATGNQTEPSISGDFCAWQDKRGSTNDIYVKNISNLSNPQNAIAGDRLTYLASPAPALATSINVVSSAGLTAGDRLYLSATGKFEWVTVASIVGNAINLTTSIVTSGGFPLNASVTGLWEQKHPAIYSGGSTYKVVWEDDRKQAGLPNPAYDVYMYNSATGQTSAVATSPLANEAAPAISSSGVVWQDNRNGDYDIYMLPGAPTVTDDGAWTGSSSQLHATWTYLGTATRYEYAIGTSAGGTQVRGWTDVGLTTETTASGLSLTNGSTFYVSVRAYDGAAYSDAGSSDGIRVDIQAPTVPGSVNASAGNGTASVTWSASTDALSGMDRYRVYRATAEGGPYSQVGSPTGTSYPDSGLTNGTTYWYKVSAVDKMGNESAQSSATSATPKAPPPTVTDDGAWTGSSSQLHASWTPVSGATSYEYAVGTTAGGTDTRSWTDSGASTEITATSLPLSNGATYYISIRAKNGGNVSSQVGSSNGIRVDIQPPTVPGGVSASGGVGTASVSWSASTDALSGMDFYRVYRATVSGGPYASVNTTTGLSYNDSGLTNGTTYWYKISATDKMGNESAQSVVASATPGNRTTSLSLEPTSSTVAYEETATLSGYLRSTSPTVSPIETATPAVYVQRRIGGGDWETISPGRPTGPSGLYTYSLTPTQNASYQAVWPGGGGYSSATSPLATINVAGHVTLNLSRTLMVSGRTYGTWARYYRAYRAYYLRYRSAYLRYYRAYRRTRSARYRYYMYRYRAYMYRYYRYYARYLYIVRKYSSYRTCTMSGDILPAHDGKTLTIMYKYGDWRPLTDTTTSAGAYSETWAPYYPGTFYVRTHFPADDQNAEGYSAYQTIVVK